MQEIVCFNIFCLNSLCTWINATTFVCGRESSRRPCHGSSLQGCPTGRTEEWQPLGLVVCRLAAASPAPAWRGRGPGFCASRRRCAAAPGRVCWEGAATRPGGRIVSVPASGGKCRSGRAGTSRAKGAARRSRGPGRPAGSRTALAGWGPGREGQLPPRGWRSCRYLTTGGRGGFAGRRWL